MTPGLRRLIDYLQDKNNVILDDRSIKDNLLGFLRLPYFDRVWILQEIGLSRLVTLIIGTLEVRWTGVTISKMLELCFTLGIQAPSILRWKPSSRPTEEQDVLAVLSKSRNCSATNPCDKVYALLGLMHPEFSTQFPIDYSLSPSEVFTKLAVYCIEGMGRFDVLQHCYHVPESGGSNPRRTPTWIPQWDFKDVYEPPPTQFSEVDKHTFASAWHMPDTNPGTWLRHELPRRLLIEQMLNGFAVDTDADIDCTNLSTAICREQVRKWAELHSIYKPDRSFSSEDLEYLAQQIVYQQSQKFTYKILDRAAWKRRNAPAKAPPSPKLPYLKLRAHRLGNITRCLGQISDARQFHVPQTTWPALGFHYCQICIDSGISPINEDALKEERKGLTLNIETYGAGKAAFTTDYSAGFARGKFRLGDSIWALHGANVPFVLREVENHYHLIGDCYLHRVGRPFPCKHCGADAAPWPMQTEIIDLW